MLKLPCYLTGFSSKSDGSASIRFSTQELSSEDFANLKNFLNTFGWLAYRENGLQDEDIPDEDAEENKKPSRRLRATLYVLHKQNGGTDETWESFYREQIEKIITHIKSKLE